EHFSILADNDDLLSDETTVTTSSTLVVPGYGNDREIYVTALARTPEGADLTPLYVNILKTPLTPTLFERLGDLFSSIRTLVTRFASRSLDILESVISSPSGFFNTLSDGVRGAVGQFFADLPNTLRNGFLGWLQSRVGTALNGLVSIDLGSPNGVATFLMRYAGLTWEHVQQVLRQQLGEGNLAAVTRIADLFNGYD